MANDPQWHVDRNVYILGAGFSYQAGMPLIKNFLEEMRSAFFWLGDNGRSDEADAIKEVMRFRQKASASAARINIDIDNIEDLFSLIAAGKESDELEAKMTTAIASTLDYAYCTKQRLYTSFIRQHSDNARFPKSWETPDNQTYYAPLYDYYVAIMLGWLKGSEKIQDNTFITFNYDLMLDMSMHNLGINPDYALRQKDDGVEKLLVGDEAPRVKVLKLHGSLNWRRRDGLVVSVPRYNFEEPKDFDPILVPPTWRKTLSGGLSNVWQEAVEALSKATRIIVIGYSMPPTDVQFKYLLGAGFQDNCSFQELFFVGPSVEERKEMIFSTLREYPDRIKLRPMSAHSYLTTEDTRKEFGRPVADMIGQNGYPSPLIKKDNRGQFVSAEA